MAAALTDEQIERLHLEYAQAGKIDRAAKAVGVSWAAARKYLSQPIDPNTPLSRVREQKRVDIAEKIADVQIKLLDAIPGKLINASLQEVSTAFGILTDKRQLITGQATERHEHRDLDEPRADLARRIDELADRRRAKGVAGRTEAVGS